MISRPLLSIAGLGILIVALFFSSRRQPSELFPEPFMIRVRSSVTGFVVTRHYFGNLVVTEVPEGFGTVAKRTIVDFENRVIVEIFPETRTHTVLTFDELFDLQRRFREATGQHSHHGTETGSELQISELGDFERRPTGRFFRSRHVVGYLVAREGEVDVEVWVDRRIRLPSSALDALVGFDRSYGRANADHLDLARRQSRGAIIVALRDSIAIDQVDGTSDGWEALTVGRHNKAPTDLLRMPIGSERRAHHLQALIPAVESEEHLRRRLAGIPD